MSCSKHNGFRSFGPQWIEKIPVPVFLVLYFWWWHQVCGCSFKPGFKNKRFHARGVAKVRRPCSGSGGEQYFVCAFPSVALIIFTFWNKYRLKLIQMKAYLNGKSASHRPELCTWVRRSPLKQPQGCQSTVNITFWARLNASKRPEGHINAVKTT